MKAAGKRTTIELMLRPVLLIFLCQSLSAQGPSQPDPSTLAHVEGRVMNAVTGEPLRKADVHLHGSAGEYMATSDGSGHFTIDLVAPGSYNLNAQHQNFSTLSYGATRPGMPGTKITLAAGQTLSSVEMKLIPFGVISGKVVDQDGDPVTGIPISVMQWGLRGGAGGLCLRAAGHRPTIAANSVSTTLRQAITSCWRARYV